VEKSQYNLLLEVLKRFEKTGLLKEFILIGSWCVYLYKEYFSNMAYIPRIVFKTRDVDFLIDDPKKIKKEVDIPMLLRDLGFVIIFKGRSGYLKLDHPDLMIEFLTVEKGRGKDKPVPVKNLHINAVALRFLSFLTDNTIKTKIDDVEITIPHPVNFALHKLIISQRRIKKEKALKDRNAAVEILRALIKNKKQDEIQKTFKNVPKKWQSKILSGLDSLAEADIKTLLQ